jgi:dTDP-4-dehydrorhamnose reductase
VRIVVTGAGGGLGRAFLAAAPTHHHVVPLGHADLDVGDHDAVMATVPLHRPHAIVNCAAFTRVDRNETDPRRAFRDNAQGPHSLALAARASGAVLLHVSTDYVFDGEKGVPYDETDEPHPISVYGRAKLAGERMVRDTLAEHFVVRTGYVFGGGDDYLSGQVERLRRGETAAGIEDRTGSPTWVLHLAERLLPLLHTRRFGTYHLAGPEETSWYRVLVRCRELGDLPGDVTPQRADDLGLVAPRPRSSALTSVFLANLPVPAFPPLDHALASLVGR